MAASLAAPDPSGPNSGTRLPPWVSDGEAVLQLAVRGPAPLTRLPGPEPGACGPDPRSPRPPPFAPPTPRTVARRCSPASPLLWRGLTSPVRASSATAPRLPDADQTARGPVVGREISRFPCQERACMPGSLTTPDRPGARAAISPTPPLGATPAGQPRSSTARRVGTGRWRACNQACRTNSEAARRPPRKPVKD